MNCFEFRRLCLSIPASTDSDYVAHADECSECRRYADGVLRMDDSLVRALDISVPDDLVARLKLRTVIDSEQARRSRSRTFCPGGKYRAGSRGRPLWIPDLVGVRAVSGID